MENTLIVMMGPAGIGKSYIAKKFAETHEDTIICSRDAIRFSLLKDGEDYFAHEDEVIKKFYKNISDALRVHKYVIADATHITIKARNQLFSNIKIPSTTKVIGFWIEAPIQIAIKQNEQRSGLAKVPEDAIRRMYKHKVSPRETEPFDEIFYISKDVDLAIGKKSIKITDIMTKMQEIC